MINQIFKKIFWKLFNTKKIISKKYFLVKDYSFISNEEIFKRVYEQKIWNKTSDLDFDSGPGSHNVDVLKPYLDAVTSPFGQIHFSLASLPSSFVETICLVP